MGIGNADFSNMEILDGDDGLWYYSNNVLWVNNRDSKGRKA